MDSKRFGKHVTTFHSMLCQVFTGPNLPLFCLFGKVFLCLKLVEVKEKGPKGTKRARKARESCIFRVFGFAKKDVGE